MTPIDAISLKDTERKAYTSSSFRHGLWDLLIAYVALEFALLPYVNLLVYPVWIVILLLIFWLQARVVRPRLGVVRYGAMRTRRIQRSAWVMVGAGLLFFAVFLYLSHQPGLDAYGSAIRLGLCFLVPLCLAAWLLEFTRLYAYGAMLGLAPSVGEWLFQNAGVPHHGIVVTFGVSAAVIFMIAIVLFIQVLRLPPLNTEKET